jgi:hypothetical protein
MRNSSGLGENIADNEVYDLTNLEVDLDGSLVNRPAIAELTLNWTTGGSVAPSPITNLRIIGRYRPNDGRIFLVISVSGTVRLINASSGIAEPVTATVDAVTCIQYNNKLWVIPAPGSASSGGQFDATAATVTYTAVAAIPQGESAVLYKERIFVGCGINATSNTARVRFSAIADPTTWNGVDNFDVSPGDGEKLVDLVVVANDIIILKEHSTYRFTYSKAPSAADLSVVDTKIGVPAINCAVVYNSNTVYVLHDNAVYELVNSLYKRISAAVSLTQVLDVTLNAYDTYGLTLFRDRLFVRYYTNLYVYSLRVQRWSKWTTARKFSKLTVVATAGLGLDTAYAHSATSDLANKIFLFRDDRVTGVGSTESYDWSMQTKITHFQMPHQFKVISHGHVELATSGNFTTTIRIPNSVQNPTWDYEEANFIWDDPGNWDDFDLTAYSAVVAPGAGEYNVKDVKSIRQKFRFRTMYILMSGAAIASTNGADSSVKIIGMVVFLREAQLTPKETN